MGRLIARIFSPVSRTRRRPRCSPTPPSAAASWRDRAEQLLGTLDADDLPPCRPRAPAVVAASGTSAYCCSTSIRGQPGTAGLVKFSLAINCNPFRARSSSLRQDPGNFRIFCLQRGEVRTPEWDVGHGCSEEWSARQCTGQGRPGGRGVAPAQLTVDATGRWGPCHNRP